VMTPTRAQADVSLTEQAAITGSSATDTVTGNIAFTDAALNDVHPVGSGAPQAAGYLGSLTPGALSDSTGGVTGFVPWSFSVADNALDFLAAGEALGQRYGITVAAGH